MRFGFFCDFGAKDLLVLGSKSVGDSKHRQVMPATVWYNYGLLALSQPSSLLPLLFLNGVELLPVEVSAIPALFLNLTDIGPKLDGLPAHNI